MTSFAVVLVVLFGPYDQAPHARTIATHLADRASCEALAAAVNEQHPALAKAVCVRVVP